MDEQRRCSLCAAPLASEVRCDACGALLQVAGYALGAPLAVGGNSRVFSGRRLSDGTEVAIKLLELSKTSDWKSYELFARGTQTLQTLSHPGLPRVFAFERDQQGRLYQIRERFEGGTLRERVEQLHSLTPERARSLLIGLLRVLQYLHGRLPPIIHRDIKPSNVMFRQADSWEPVLIDFESIALAQASTGTTIVVSPGYTAPEQLGGRTTPQSDLYSLAATFLYACTGSEPDDARRGMHGNAKLFAGLDDTTAAVLRQMVEPIPEQRIASATAALRQLNQPHASIAQLSEPSRMARASKLALTVAALAALMLAAISLGGNARERRFKQAMAGLGLDFNLTSDQVILQSAKGVAADIGVELGNCTVTRHQLRGSYAAMMRTVKQIDGLDPSSIGELVDGDTFLVLGCDVTPYASLPVGVRHMTFAFRSAYGVRVN